MSEDPSEGSAQARDCPKCGALLPNEDEGLCEMCGTAFGRITATMAPVTPEMVARYEHSSSSRGGVGAPGGPNAPSAVWSDRTLLLAGIAIAVLIVVLAVALVVAL